MKFAAVMVFMAVWLTLNYLPMAHMGWGGGWVFNLGSRTLPVATWFT